ncbi:hypothetical protein BKI52_22325 [marine bacterium AO1-C]|nr:hypothetical protein BKI52_22325 [marine bacterium AO1-C]
MAKLLNISLIITLLGLMACGQSNQQKQDNDQALKTKGKAIAQETFKALSKELKAALQKGGVAEAVPYCSINALPLTQTIAKKHNVSIRRTSLHIRNPKNFPNTQERKVLEDYEQSLKTGKTPKPQLTRLSDKQTMFNAPIFIKPLCLNCHGKVGEQISKKNYALIKSSYPNDKATNYKMAELRGMWSIVFQKK